MTFKIYTLGCKVNTYESNVIEEQLQKEGFKLVNQNEHADIIIVNTCTVTNTADNKSKKIIHRAKNEGSIVVAVGCMIQNKKEDDNADILIGNVGKSSIADYIRKYVQNKEKIIDIKDVMDTCFEEMKLDNFNKTRAFVKIQDGCNNFCSYCIIPYTRGNVRSKKREDVLTEIIELIKKGHKEIVLTGIHTGHYGEDNENYKFADLLLDILKINGLERLRISSIEITELDEKFLEVLKNNKILVDHMHIPLQSGCDKILKLMNRKYDTKYFIEKINKIRKIRPDISITTDVIVGFPNETDKNFNETIETIKKVDFSKLHVFPYSKREGTKAATMEGQVKEEIKKQRVMELLKLSKELENKYMNKFIGKTLTFIPEVYKDGYLIGHTGNYLLIKLKGCEELLHKEVSVKLMENQYPYIISSAI